MKNIKMLRNIDSNILFAIHNEAFLICPNRRKDGKRNKNGNSSCKDEYF